MNIFESFRRKKGEMEEAMVWQEVVSSEDQLSREGRFTWLWRRGEKTFAEGRRCKNIDMMNNEHAVYECTELPKRGERWKRSCIATTSLWRSSLLENSPSKQQASA